jgi:DNA-binding SARP family transcriptional activator
MLTVQTFGKFQVTDGTELLDEETLHSPMLLKLLMYLVLYRDKTLTTEDIADAIWQDENIENPAGALKNLMYRLRKVLIASFGEADFILTNRGSYHWNPNIQVNIDIDEFERLISKAKLENICEKAIVSYEQAIQLYQGDFMAQLMDMSWIVPLNSYYHSMYLTVVKALAELYVKKEQFELLEKLCSEALCYESGDEQLYCYQIEARMHCGKISLALESYEKARDIMEKELGVRSTTILNKVYEELLTMSKGQSTYSITEVQKDIIEEEPDGVFMCGYPIFKEIYHYEARKNAREDVEESLLLLTLSAKKELAPEHAEFQIKHAMMGLEETIRESLRLGDVAAKYSDSQFILLLPSCTRRLALHVANRLIAKLHEKNANSRNVSVRINIEKVSTSSEMVD